MSTDLRISKTSLGLGALSVLLAGALVGQLFATGAPQQTPLTWTGVVTDNGGSPYTQAVDVRVAFYDKASGGKARCTSATVKAEAKTGRFSVVLPGTCAKAVMDTTDLWVEATVGPKSTVMPRQHIGAVPYALTTASAAIATKSLDLQCNGCVTVAELNIDKDLDLKGKGLKAGTVTATKVDFGPGAKDELTAAHVKTLVGGGNADALHTHAGSGGGSGGAQVITFKGITTGTFKGSSELATMDDACAKQYGKARVCTTTMLANVYPRAKPSSRSWTVLDGPWISHSNQLVAVINTAAYARYFKTNCTAFGRPFAAPYTTQLGLTLDKDGIYKSVKCSDARPATCCGR